MSQEGLSKFNNLSEEEAVQELHRCCACNEWSRRVCARRPFASLQQLRDACDDEWWRLSSNHWRESFHGHPRIGDKAALAKKINALKPSAAAGASSSGSHGGGWEADEQKGTSGASTAVLDAIHEGNIAYEEKYGFIFLICATNKTADDMLDQLKERLNRTGAQEADVIANEVRTAAGEQAKITQLRIVKLLQSL